MPPRSVDDDNLELLLLEFSHALSGDGHRIGFSVRAKVSNLSLACGLAGLIKCPSTKCVSAND